MNDQKTPDAHFINTPDVYWRTTSWHDFSYPNVTNFKDHANMYFEIVEWIKENVLDYKNTTMWTKLGDCIYIKLKNNKDAVMFTLKFGIGSYNGPV